MQVRGDLVSNGYAIEVEDKGLGLPPADYARVNALLADPPEFDLADSDQLGLFVVAKLAQRHGIRVLLRRSPFGGTTAIVLAPRSIVTEQSALEAAERGRQGRPAQPYAQEGARGRVVGDARRAAQAGASDPPGAAAQGGAARA